MSVQMKRTLTSLSALLGLACIVLATTTSCGGGASAQGALPSLDAAPEAGTADRPTEDDTPAVDDAPAPTPDEPAPAPSADEPAPVAPPDTDPPGDIADEAAVPAGEPAAEEADCSEPLDAIPLDFEGYPAPYSGYISASQALDGVSVPGGSAVRLWLDDAHSRIAFAYIMDWQSEDAASARLEELRPNNAVNSALGADAWQGEDASSAGYPGFRAVAFRSGRYLVLIAAGVSDASSVAAPMEALLALGQQIYDCLAEHELVMPEGLEDSPAAVSSLKLSGGDPGLGKLVSGAKKTAMVPLDLIKGGKKMGSITFKLVMTMTEQQCEGGVVFIVDVYISEISLGDDDGDGFGKGAGDIMVGGDISVSFKAGDKVTSGKAGPFATGEIGDVDANSTAKEGAEGTELPRFIGSVKGCGFPDKVDFDILVRDSDEGTDFQDLVGVGGTAAAEYLVGNETAKRLGEAIEKAGEKAQDESGTDGMKILRKRKGDDIGEAHDKQVSFEAK